MSESLNGPEQSFQIPREFRLGNEQLKGVLIEQAIGSNHRQPETQAEQICSAVSYCAHNNEGWEIGISPVTSSSSDFEILARGASAILEADPKDRTSRLGLAEVNFVRLQNAVRSEVTSSKELRDKRLTEYYTRYE